jgi:hypothetical protein
MLSQLTTYDSSQITREDRSNSHQYTRYLIASVPLLSLAFNSRAVVYTIDSSESGGSGFLQWIDFRGNPASDGQYQYKQATLSASDGFGNYSFFAYSRLGKSFDGSPFADSYAMTSSIDTISGPNPTSGSANSGVTFSSLSPVTVPTPALLPGLVSLGLGVLRKRKAQTKTVLERA